MSLFNFLSKRERQPKPPKAAQPKYIYKPYENSMAYRVEYREGVGYVYLGWGKSFLFKIEDGRILSPEGELLYILMEDKLMDAAGEKLLCRIRGGELWLPGKREPEYLIKDSIRVQGTI